MATRRDFLKTAGAAAIAGQVVACGDDGGTTPPADAGVSDTTGGDTSPALDSGPTPDEGPALPELDEYQYDGALGPDDLFSHGVASGDPLADAVMLWTRVSPAVDHTGPVEVWWEIALDMAFTMRLKAETASTDASRDYTLKVDATGLFSGTAFYYRFKALGRTSPVGRTKTAPTGSVERLSLAVMSCSNYQRGYFHAYKHMAARPGIDACLHLGDYIYEPGGTDVRTHDPDKTCVTLQDYRTRYAQYRTDPDCRAAHQQHPFICVWDDHEIANNGWKDGAAGHNPLTDGAWADRKAAAMQAYLEWLPVREQANPVRIFRSFAFGDLVDLIMLDTRYWGRDSQVDPADAVGLADETRRMMGQDQHEWLDQQLQDSQAVWRVVGQQVMVAPLQAGGDILNSDQWDGYPAARRRFLTSLAATTNAVVLTGDIHSSWANELPLDTATYDPETGDGAVAVEFIATGITSGFPLGQDLVQLAKQLNPWVRYANVAQRGYFVIDITPDRIQAAFNLVEDVTDPDNDTVAVDEVWRIDSGTVRLAQDETAVPDREDAAALAR